MSGLGLGDFVRRAKVVGLYRRLLRAARDGGVVGGHEQVVSQFRAFQHLEDKATIAQLIHEGEKQAEMVEGLRGVGAGADKVEAVLKEQEEEGSLPNPLPSKDASWPWSK